MTEVATGVHRAGSALINWYLVEDGGRVPLVDAGVPGYWPQLDDTLATIGRFPSGARRAHRVDRACAGRCRGVGAHPRRWRPRGLRRAVAARARGARVRA